MSRFLMGSYLNAFKNTFSLFFAPLAAQNLANRARCVGAFLLVLVDVAVASLVPYYSKQIINVLSLNISQTIWATVLLLGFFWILAKTVMHIQEIVFFPVVNTTIRNLNYNLVKHIHHIPLPYYQALSIPEVINCARRISPSARAFMKVLFLMIIPTFLKLLVAVIVTIRMGFFGVLLLPAILLSVFILYKGTKWYVVARGSAWKVSDKVTTRLSDSILNTKIARQSEAFEMEQVGDCLNKEAELWHKTNTRLHTIYVMIGILLGLTITAILTFAALAIQQKVLTVGDFVLLQGQLIAAFLPLKTFSVEFRQLAESLVDIKKIIEIFNIAPEKSHLSNPKQNVPLGIVIDNVTFSHEHEKTVFKDLSLRISPGEKVGIIGESGCGKSTLMNLIAGFYRPSAGHIYIQGQEVTPFSAGGNDQGLHYIPQDFRLFNASLRDNLTYGSSTVSEEALISLCDQLGLGELIQQMPNGMDTLVGEMGIKLSGGEKQKVALARALLLKPQILLLDETTNALNLESERMILHVLFSRVPTVILVCHKAVALPGLTQILKIKQGKLQKVELMSQKAEAVN